MDNRLYDIAARRPGPLRKDDLDALARAMVAVIRGRGQAGFQRRQGTDVLVIAFKEEHGCPGSQVPAKTVTVLKSDWAKIWPHTKDFFDPLLFPTASRVAYKDPKLARSESVFDRADGQHDGSLYQRIRSVLDPLFPTAFPTTNL